MLAVRDNERAAAAEAVNTVRTKLIAFGLSAFMAGLAGGLFAYLYGHLSFDSFAPLASVTFVTTAYIGGIGSIAGAVIAGIISAGGPVFQLFASSPSVSGYQALIAGVGVVLTAVLNPDGVAPEFNKNYKALMARLRRGKTTPAAAGPAIAVPAAAPAAERAPISIAGAAAERRRHGGTVLDNTVLDNTVLDNTVLGNTGLGNTGRDAAPLLDARGIRVAFGSMVAVDSVDFTVRPGSLVGLIGPNGAGKTTFIDAVCGFVPAGGSVRFDGQQVEHRPAHERARLGLRRTFQTTELFEDLTIRENLIVPARARAAGGDEPASNSFSVEEILRLLDLQDKAECLPRELSTGEAKLAGLARALRGEPKLLLLDEPAAGLDSQESRELGRRLLSLLDLGISMVLVDHDLELVMGVCDEVVVLDRGQLLAAGPPQTVRRDPAVRAAYIGGADDQAASVTETKEVTQ
jgi:ABC-type branched-subunit amino acid transport system ATPase component